MVLRSVNAAVGVHRRQRWRPMHLGPASHALNGMAWITCADALSVSARNWLPTGAGTRRNRYQ
jgi:hypothetical protein